MPLADISDGVVPHEFEGRAVFPGARPPGSGIQVSDGAVVGPPYETTKTRGPRRPGSPPQPWAGAPPPPTSPSTVTMYISARSRPLTNPLWPPLGFSGPHPISTRSFNQHRIVTKRTPLPLRRQVPRRRRRRARRLREVRDRQHEVRRALEGREARRRDQRPQRQHE